MSRAMRTWEALPSRRVGSCPGAGVAGCAARQSADGCDGLGESGSGPAPYMYMYPQALNPAPGTGGVAVAVCRSSFVVRLLTNHVHHVIFVHIRV